MKKTSDYYLRNEFTDYVRDLHKVDRPDQKTGYLGSILDNVLTPLGCGILINDIEKAIKCKDSKEKVFEGLDVIYGFLKKLVWIKNNFPSNKTIKSFLKDHDLNSYSVNAWPSVIPDYKEYLKQEIDNGNIVPKTSPRYAVTNWNNAIKKLEEIEIEIISQKGTDSLLSHFNDCNNFLSIVLNDCYFFSSDLAKSRFDEIATAIQKCEELYARHSKKDKIQSDDKFCYESELSGEKKSIHIIIDKDGNTAVRDLIKDKTGYTISAGYDSIFLFYVISHIWGDAFDPRNFTNFWNLVLVPGWANFILDKQGAEDEFAKKMINTFKAICIKHYKMESLNWQLIDKDYNNLKPAPQYVVNGKYTINVINRKKGGQDHGKIEQKVITI